MVRRRSCAVSNHEATMGLHPSRRGQWVRAKRGPMINSDAAPQDEGLRSKAIMTLTLPSTFVIDSAGDAARAAELRRVKWLATLVLAATFAVFIGAKWLLPIHPAYGFVA